MGAQEIKNQITLTQDTVIRPNGYRCYVEGPWTLCPMDPSEFNLQELTLLASLVAHARGEGIAPVICGDILKKIEEHCKR